MSFLRLYTDGSCSGNPGPGGWAWVLVEDSNTRKDGIPVADSRGNELSTTNNRMEMSAVVKGLDYISAWCPEDRVLLLSDSKYVVNGIQSGMHIWEHGGWKTAAGSPVKNPDLWKSIFRLCKELYVRARHVRGHSGNRWNEWCDRKAVEQCQIARQLGKN